MTSKLPEVPADYAWHIIEAHHSNGVTYWLRLTDSIWSTIARSGWRTGYKPTPEQIERRAYRMLGQVREWGDL